MILSSPPVVHDVDRPILVEDHLDADALEDLPAVEEGVIVGEVELVARVEGEVEHTALHVCVIHGK